MDPLLALTAAALAGLASRPRGGGGTPQRTDEEIGAEAAAMARGALAAYGPSSYAASSAPALTADDVRAIVREAFEEAATAPAAQPKKAKG